MCTVTFVPKEKGFIFTSNRDEEASRKTLAPERYQIKDTQLFFPKDGVAGGTWIGTSDKKRLACILNGGFHWHDPLKKFPQSRGNVVKDLLQVDDVEKYVDETDFSQVAPFTLIIIDWEKELSIKELVWCKNEKHFNELDVHKNHIWSSSTLYTKEIKIAREEWFAQFMEKGSLDEATILDFHQNTKLGDAGTAPKMKRNRVETISTTQVGLNNDSTLMRYIDYVNDIDEVYKDLFACKTTQL